MDTAQPVTAAETDPNAAIASAADAFKAFDAGEPVARPREDNGRFAAAEPEEELAEGEAQAEPEVEGDEQEAAEEAQPMPPSWPEDQAEHWNQLPPETQDFILSREGERERAVQAKFQESANVRKAAEAVQAEAVASRRQYAEALDTVIAAIQPVKPDPRAFGYGTQQYDAGGFNLALAQYEEQAGILSQITDQRESIQKEAAEEAANAFRAWKADHEAEYAPRFLADVPEFADPVKAEPMARSLVDYAIKAGIPEQLFAPDVQDQITSAQLHLLWKAMRFDQLKASAPAAKPKPAGPAVRPGVSSPRSATTNVQRQKAYDRLARDGSVESGAAVFKSFMGRIK